MIKLIIEDDEGKTTVVPLIRDEISIGRKEGNTIRLTERNISRQHARLCRGNGAVFIEDLQSYNGIRVNGNRISGRVAITEGDRVQIGDYVIGLKVEGAVKPAEDAATTELPRIDGDTERISSAERMAAMDTAIKPPRARLVCISANFAGREVPLDKPLMVLGRTDDNDVVINHRSISRHHCRLVEENSRYTIVDLQSANGVRVNGEEYGKVELRRGDQIDLGHVRLRFVGPGEDFVFERDATIYDTGDGGGPSRAVWIGLIAVALGAAAFFVWQYLDSRRGPDVGLTDSQEQAATSVHRQDKTQTELLAKIEQASTNEAWNEVISFCEKLDDSHRPQAGPRCENAPKELRWKKVFEDANGKAGELKTVAALELFNGIPAESVYATKRDESAAFKNAREQFLNQKVAEIASLVRRGACDDADKRAAEVRKLIADDKTAQAKADNCTPREAVSAASRPRVRRVVRKRPKPDASLSDQEPTPERPKEDPKAILETARRAYVAGHHAQAINAARRVLAIESGSQHALQILGASACYTNNVRLATSAYQRLNARLKLLLKNVCSRNGIELQ
ncbi:MAG: FHA domain-containing protein [Deltaproteobacteria bacterium]|nr:FHA domain-containing protein [Deltaproteobacteria bacterium]